MIFDIITEQELSEEEFKTISSFALPLLKNERCFHHAFRYILTKNKDLIVKIVDNNGKIYNIIKPISLQYYGIDMSCGNRREVIGRLLNDRSLSGSLDGVIFQKINSDPGKVRSFILKHAPSKEVLKARHRSYRLRNIEKSKLRLKSWKKSNKEHVTSYNRKYFNERGKCDIDFRIRRNLRARLRLALKGEIKKGRTISLLGCSIEEFRTYIESKFTENMNWDNYGVGANKWQIDHIVPCCSFNLSEEEDQKKCCHYTNLQPLWAIENSKKGASLNYNSPIV